jgi:sterol desaturase/sphingolipid hydroxylase (fatty acid hydroxylase superfamily)
MMLLIISLLVFVVITFFGYCVHKSLHQPWMKQFYESHMVHHLKMYPITDYMSDVYRHAGKHSTTYFFALVSIPILTLPLLLFLFGFISLFTMIFIITEMMVLGWLHNYIHDAFHINNHILNKIPVINKLFFKLNRLHFIHHKDMTKNFGIFAMFWDKLFKSYSE